MGSVSVLLIFIRQSDCFFSQAAGQWHHCYVRTPNGQMENVMQPVPAPISTRSDPSAWSWSWSLQWRQKPWFERGSHWPSFDKIERSFDIVTSLQLSVLSKQANTRTAQETSKFVLSFRNCPPRV